MDKKELFVVKRDGFGYFSKMLNKTKIRWASRPNYGCRYVSKIFAEKRANKIGGYVIGYTLAEWVDVCKSKDE